MSPDLICCMLYLSLKICVCIFLPLFNVIIFLPLFNVIKSMPFVGTLIEILITPVSLSYPEK